MGTSEEKRVSRTINRLLRQRDGTVRDQVDIQRRGYAPDKRLSHLIGKLNQRIADARRELKSLQTPQEDLCSSSLSEQG